VIQWLKSKGENAMTSVSQLIPLLPDSYEEDCIKLGIIRRQRAIKTPADLMMLILFHLLNGCTLMEISEVGRLTNIGKFSDVAFMKKFSLCAVWFQLISAKLMQSVVADYPKPKYLDNYRVIAYDASDVVEKGKSGRTFRLHFGIDIFSMSSVQYKITGQNVGETLANFTMTPGDLAIADRIYGTLKSMEYCTENGADYIFRLRAKYFRIYDEQDARIDLLEQFACLRPGESKDIIGYSKNADGVRVPIRVCVKQKPSEAIEATRKKLARKGSRKQETISEEAKKFNEYIAVVTSLPPEVSAEDVLETYRLRWQVECYFKRLKTIMDFGEMPKKREDSILAWLNGKIMVALLVEMLLSAKSFSPCDVFGYRQEYMERDEDDYVNHENRSDSNRITAV
jgi:hypothetical protein